MKIILVGTAYPLRGGIAHHTMRLAEELGARHDVSIVTFRRQFPALLFPGTTQMESEGAMQTAVTERLIDSINPLNWIRVGLALRKRKPDLLLVAYAMPFLAPSLGTIAALVRRNGVTRTVFLCHNIAPHERIPFARLLTRFAFRQADAFLVQSEQVRRDLLAILPDARHALSPHPVYDVFGPALPRDESRENLGITTRRIVLFFGYIRAYKGLDILLESIGLLRDPEVTLLVVGECYGDRSTYERQAASLGIASNVRFVFAYVPQSDIARYFSAADVVVLPYRSATQSGIAQVAYHFDRPLIVTDVGGLAEVVVEGKTGMIVPPGDPDALAGALRCFFRDSDPEKMAVAIREEKKKYSWKAMAAAIERLAGEKS